MCRTLIAGGVLVLAVWAAGCNRADGPTLHGRLLADGQPFAVARPGDFDLKFLTVEGVGPQKKSYMAAVQRDGTFTFHGATGKGIPPARYKIVIYTDDTYQGRTVDKFRGAFTEENTPLIYEVRDGVTEITIDLAKKTVE